MLVAGQVGQVQNRSLGINMVLVLVQYLIIYILICVIPMWKVFKKAGKPVWASIIPLYNISVLFEISGMNPLLILLVLFSLFIPVVRYIVVTILFILTNIKLAQKFNKGNEFAIGLILLNPVFMWILGFDKSQYHV